MLKITYTNGDIQNIKVSAEFFTITVVEKNGVKEKITPLDKAETLAHDLAINRNQLTQNSEVATINLVFPGNRGEKTKHFKAVVIPEPVERLEASPSYTKELKRLKKLFKNIPFTQKWKT